MNMMLWPTKLVLTMMIVIVYGHMKMKFPHPRGDPEDPLTGAPDYNLNAPLESAKMCNGKPPGQVTARFRAGGTVNVLFEGSARHGGGYCQFALSYDEGRTFTVIQESIGSCPNSAYSWPVILPENLPSCKKCIFAWAWVNAIGNREFYMNCADVAITGGRGSRISGRKMFLANLPGFPQYTPPLKDGGPANSKTNRYKVTVS